MPNHVLNELTIEGDKKQIERLLRKIKTKERCIDFEKIIPMPRHIYRDSLSKGDEENHGKQNCWYEWCRFNWGTKWNAYDSERTGGRSIQFLTAWTYPRPIIRELSKMYPAFVFHCHYRDEGGGFEGCVRVKDGHEDSIETIPESCGEGESE